MVDDGDIARGSTMIDNEVGSGLILSLDITESNSSSKLEGV